MKLRRMDVVGGSVVAVSPKWMMKTIDVEVEGDDMIGDHRRWRMTDVMDLIDWMFGPLALS